MSDPFDTTEECDDLRTLAVLLLQTVGASECRFSRAQFEAAELTPSEVLWDAEGVTVRLAGGS